MVCEYLIVFTLFQFVVLAETSPYFSIVVSCIATVVSLRTKNTNHLIQLVLSVLRDFLFMLSFLGVLFVTCLSVR